MPLLRRGARHPLRRPNKRKAYDRVLGLRAELGLDIADPDPIALLHKTRQQAGAAHKRRDIGNAPWPEDREPGKRYDTLPKETA
ncbi:hypothetical protein ACIQUW_15075 [Streptomyces sp. NPDC101117]|uniref:hypothetical protein n=1 Tax=Streptomyces sp. NPDC101117 TaxID=3366108 RepID=UPI00381169B5